MTSPTEFDRHARRLHGASLDALSPRVQAQLAQRRHAVLGPRGPARSARSGWGWLGAAATACVVVVALQLSPPALEPAQPRRAPAIAETPPSDPGGVLAEDPDFYLWLASGESQAYAWSEP